MVDQCEMELVDGTKGEYLSVDPSAFTYMLINAIQELKLENSRLKDSDDAQQVLIQKLLEQNINLSSRLEALESAR